MNQIAYNMPSHLKPAADALVDCYNYCHYHEAGGNVTPDDVYDGRKEMIVVSSKKQNGEPFRLDENTIQ